MVGVSLKLKQGEHNVQVPHRFGVRELRRLRLLSLLSRRHQEGCWCADG